MLPVSQELGSLHRLTCGCLCNCTLSWDQEGYPCVKARSGCSLSSDAWGCFELPCQCEAPCPSLGFPTGSTEINNIPLPCQDWGHKGLYGTRLKMGRGISLP